MDGHYLRADSLMDAAVEKTPNDLQVLAVSLGFKNELNDLDGEVERLEAIVNATGNYDLIETLYSSLLAAGRVEEAERQLLRLEMMGAAPDSQEIHRLRFSAFERSCRAEAMAVELAAMDHTVEEDMRDLLQSSLDMVSERFTDAAVILERLLADRPTDSFLCNNLAWCYALPARTWSVPKCSPRRLRS